MTTIHARTPIRLLRIFAGIFLVTCTVSTSAFTQTTTQPSRFLLGADISALAQVEQRGAVFATMASPATPSPSFRGMVGTAFACACL